MPHCKQQTREVFRLNLKNGMIDNGKNFRCPEVVLTINGKMRYNEVIGHPNWEKIKECIKNDSLYK